MGIFDFLVKKKDVQYSNEGVHMSERGQHLKALLKYDQALSLNPDNAVTWYNRGVSLTALNRHKEALASYDRALALEPGNPEVLEKREYSMREFGGKF